MINEGYNLVVNSSHIYGFMAGVVLTWAGTMVILAYTDNKRLNKEIRDKESKLKELTSK